MMKKIVVLALLSIVFLASCKIDMNGWNKIEPSKNIVKNEYKMDSFDQMEVDLVANVKFIQGKEGDYRVVLSCPDNYVDLIGFDVNSAGELEVHFAKDNVNIDAEHVDITVYAPGLKRLENCGVASVEIDKLNAYEFEVENSGVGSIYLSGLEVKSLEAECSGVGGIQLAGVAQSVDLECSGVGSIKGDNLKAKTVKAEVSGVGGISCYASDRIEGEVSGVGSLKYGGQPGEKVLKRDGIGEIVEL